MYENEAYSYIRNICVNESAAGSGRSISDRIHNSAFHMHKLKIHEWVEVETWARKK